MKYSYVVRELEDDLLYTPSSITAFAVENELLKARDPEGVKVEKTRLRITLGRFSNNHRFPDEGDGMVVIKGQAPTPGWFGWRWKRALNN